MMDDVHAHTLKGVIEGLRALAGSTEASMREIAESDRLPAEMRRDLARLKAETATKAGGLIEKGSAALEALRGSVITARKVSGSQASPRAIERVRRLLDEGIAPGEVAQRAAEVGDTDALRALYPEVDYLRVGGKFAEDPEPVYRTVDAGLAGAGGGSDAHDLARTADALAPAFESVAKLAHAAASGPGRALSRARIEAGYAERQAASV